MSETTPGQRRRAAVSLLFGVQIEGKLEIKGRLSVKDEIKAPLFAQKRLCADMRAPTGAPRSRSRSRTRASSVAAAAVRQIVFQTEATER